MDGKFAFGGEMPSQALSAVGGKRACSGKATTATGGNSWNPRELWMQCLSSPLKRWSIGFNKVFHRSFGLTCKCEISTNVSPTFDGPIIATNLSLIKAKRAFEEGNDKTQQDSGRSLDQLWRTLFSDPSQWLDHRFDKTNIRYPDFKHKKTQEGLWLHSKSTPYWVEAELATMAPGILQRSVFSWNTKMAMYVKSGQDRQALELFEHMQNEGMIPDRFTFIRLIKACTNLVSLENGRFVHSQAFQRGYDSDLFVGNCLIDMYSKCGSIDDALNVFKKMPKHDVVSWNTMMMGYVKYGQAERAIVLFWQMQLEEEEPDNITFVGILNACARMTALELGRHVHGLVNQSVWSTSIVVGNSLIDMYCKCKSIEDACIVFNNMKKCTAVSWSTMMIGYAKCGHGENTLSLFQQMQLERVEPDRMTYVSILNACATVAALDFGVHVHTKLKQCGYQSDVIVANSLIDMYSKCERIDYARQVFDAMPTRNAVSWNTMINGYVKCGLAEMALEVFQQMKEERIDPDVVTFIGVLNACANVIALEEGRHMHTQIILRGLDSHIVLNNCLLNMYGKCGSIEDACRVFNDMSTCSVVSWSAMLMGYVKCDQGENAFGLFRQMQREQVKPDIVILGSVLNACSSFAAVDEGMCIHLQILQVGFNLDIFLDNCLVDMYSKCGSIEFALRVFNNMVKRDVVSWNTMISGCVKCSQEDKAIELFQLMLKEKLEPDTVTYVSILNACAAMASLEEGRHVHAHLVQSEYKQDILVQNSLVDMYSKCGSIENACKVFLNMATRDVISWTTMLCGYAMHGLGNESLKLFEQLCQTNGEIDSAIFVCLLSSCSHAGLVDEGQYFFESMNPLYELPSTEDHHTCMLDLLGRAGLLEQAEDMLSNMTFQPTVSAWMALLGCCKIHGNVMMAERIAKNVFELDLENASGYALLSNIYANSGKSDRKLELQNLRVERHIYKEPGCAWIEVNKQVHSFVANKNEHPLITEIHRELKSLEDRLEYIGYVPVTKHLPLVKSEEKKEVYTCHHSEKLAISFGLLSTPINSPLRIFKNLRVCDDCHTFTKLVSKIVQRTMIVRDSTRFHHFKDGVCSCKDYW